MSSFTGRLVACAIAATCPLQAMAQASKPASKPAPKEEPVKSGTYNLDPDHGKITWSLSHLGFSTYTGQFSHVTGTLSLDPAHVDRSKLSVTIDVSSVGSFNATLDTELKGDKFLNVSTFPTATYTSTRVEPTGPKTATVHGDLTMLGVTKPVILKVTFNRAGMNPAANAYEVGFDGHAVFNRSQFGLTAYLPYVGDQVSLDLEGEFHLAP